MNTLRSLKSNNKGVSMIELIVVILILGILATMLVVNAASVNGRNAGDAAKKLSGLLDEVRLETMNREEGKMFVRVSVDKNTRDIKAQVYYKKNGVDTPGDEITLGNSGLSISFYEVDHEGAKSAPITLSSDEYIDLQFSKSTGAFTKGIDDKTYETIVFKGIRSATLVLVWDTGRSYVAND